MEPRILECPDVHWFLSMDDTFSKQGVYSDGNHLTLGPGCGGLLHAGKHAGEV